MQLTGHRPASAICCNASRAAPSRHVPATTQRFAAPHPLLQHRGSPGTAAAASQQSSATASAPDRDTQERLSSLGSVVTDAAVPEGHKGLHGFLYGEGGAEAHDSANYNFRQGEDDGANMIPVAEYLESRDGERPIGVYGLLDARRNLQYVGYARNMVLSIKGHLDRVGEERCAYVRAMVFANKAMANRSNLEREAQNWIEAEGTTPPGNGVERSLWEAAVSPAVMSAAERAEYEDKKLKMRKAMGENLADAVPGEEPDARQRRLNLIAAVEGDDWSAVIDGQTAATVQQLPEPAAAPQQQIASPFSRAGVHRTIGNDEGAAAAHPDMTVATVDAALEEVRPYLIADGGNVTVADVEPQTGTVFLRLEGACGTCPSSTATMKMGIERALKATFGDKLQHVLQIDQIDTSASVASVNEHLDMLRPAIRNYGGEVEALSVKGGKATVRYTGPPPIGMGVKAAIKDKFPDVSEVILVE